MQGIHKGPHSGKLTVMFLPMIEMHPTEPACMLSTLNFSHGLSAQHNFTTVVTFDQPLFYKAYLLINNIVSIIKFVSGKEFNLSQSFGDGK